jgi:hypothetical protein
MLLKLLYQKVYKIVVNLILDDESFVIIASLPISMKTPTNRLVDSQFQIGITVYNAWIRAAKLKGASLHGLSA